MRLKESTTEDDRMKDTSKKTLCVSRREFLIAGSGLVVGAALPLACGSDTADGLAGENDSEALGTRWEGTQKALDFVDSVHLADVDHYGEFVDFGTAARYKSTLGGWMSGWDTDTSMNGMTFTWATKSPSRFYFTAAEKTPIDFVIRAKRGGTDYFSVYLNDNPLVASNAAVDKVGEKLVVNTLDVKAGSTLDTNGRIVNVGSSSLAIDTTATLDLNLGRALTDFEVVAEFVGDGDQSAAWDLLANRVVDSSNPGFTFDAVAQAGKTYWRALPPARGGLFIIE